MVELFAVECLARSPGWSGPVPLVAQRELPTPARVERTQSATPIQPWTPLVGLVTLSQQTAVAGYTSFGLSLSPCLLQTVGRAGLSHRIEHRDCFITPVSLRRTGQARLGASGSTGPARRGGLLRALSARW